MKPRQVKGLVPAKNGDKIGLANQKSEKFFVLDTALLNIWLLCDGNRTEEKVAEEFILFLKENNKDKNAKIDEETLKSEVKTLIKKLLKYGLLED